MRSVFEHTRFIKERALTNETKIKETGIKKEKRV